MRTMVVESPIGYLCLAEEGGFLTKLSLARCASSEETPLLSEAASQLKAYFAGRLRAFDLPIAPRGTEFERRVFRALCDIPYGATATYKGLLGYGARAVGSACHKNPIPIIIPCHRVIGAGGKLTGYALGIHIKERLLLLEREGISNDGEDIAPQTLHP